MATGDGLRIAGCNVVATDNNVIHIEYNRISKNNAFSIYFYLILAIFSPRSNSSAKFYIARGYTERTVFLKDLKF